MTTCLKKLFINCISIILILALLIPTNAMAASSEPIIPYASNYLDSYSAYVYPAGSGKVQVYFTVTADYYMADIGAIAISVYESTDAVNFYWVKTFSHDSYSNMLGHNQILYGSHVDYQGVAGRYYKAEVTIYAGNGTSGDTRYYETSYKKAT